MAVLDPVTPEDVIEPDERYTATHFEARVGIPAGTLRRAIEAGDLGALEGPPRTGRELLAWLHRTNARYRIPESIRVGVQRARLGLSMLPDGEA